jgi:DNA mismatch repair protein MutL
VARHPEIRLLDPLVANQIAAGEVVERPASVVKELLENALDAGARRIRIALSDGGRTRIEVADDGCGMDEASARLAFARHATSKLRSADDLRAIATYGFRGEALASILAVARVTLTTRRAEDAIGVRLTGAGSVDVQAEPVGRPAGTTLTIEELFFNVPARLKFLRTPATELGQVCKLVDAVALARPDLHLTLVHNDRRVCDYPADPDLPRRAWAVLGAEVAARLRPVEEQGEYIVRGLLSEPSLSHPGPGHLTLLVDGRPVSDRTLQHAIAAAYGTLLERGRYPAGVLAIACPPGSVDVNVHPAKTEVRFASSHEIHAAVTRAIRPMLTAFAAEGEVAPLPVDGSAERSWPSRPPAAVVGASLARTTPWRTTSVGPAAEPAGRAGAILPLDERPRPWSGLRYVGQVGRCFLVCESAEQLVLIDQHAAHERVLFEQFVAAARAQGYPAQPLLLPATLQMSPEEVGALLEAGEVLGRLGFDLEQAGERAVRVRAQPAVLRRDLLAEVRALAASLADRGQGQSTTERLERAAATLACHAAVRAGDAMTEADARALFEQMDTADLSGWCPHGRPVVMRARFEDVGRWFQRS